MKKLALVLLICAGTANVFATECVRTATCTNNGQTEGYTCRGTLSHSMWELDSQPASGGISGQCDEHSKLQFHTPLGDTLQSGCETYEINKCKYTVRD